MAVELRARWREPTQTSAPVTTAVDATGEPGAPIAVMRIPRLGEDWSKVAVEEAGVDELKKGPGRISSTTPFGERGNTVVSGHRTTYGAPFGDLDKLAAGDLIVVESRRGDLGYRATGTEIVAPTDVQGDPDSAHVESQSSHVSH